MLGRLKKAIVYATLSASAIGWFAAPAQAASAGADYFQNQCDSGRACILLRGVASRWWNADHCGDNPVRDYYQLAVAHGNYFRVYYDNGTSVFVPAWSQVSLNPNSLIVGMRVFC